MSKACVVCGKPVDEKSLTEHGQVMNKVFLNKVHAECADELQRFLSILFNNKRSQMEDQKTVNWDKVSVDTKMSEEEIRESKDFVNWHCISKYQKLSEEFMREFKDKISWPQITRHQKLSTSFLLEFKDKFDWDFLVCNKSIGDIVVVELFKTTLKDLKNKIEKYQNLSDTTREMLGLRSLRDVFLHEKNAEERMKIVKANGLDRIYTLLGGTVIDSDGGYELVNLNLGDERVRPYLKMVNPSTGAIHIEGVEPSIKTVKKALEWRNQTGVTPSELS